MRLENKIVVLTGAGGVLCSAFAKCLAKEGAKVALLDLNEQAAKMVADEICQDHGTAIAVGADVLSRASLEKALDAVHASLGKCDILINGAGGNSPKGTTTHEVFQMEDMEREDIVSFFDLDPEGIQFVFNLNFLGTLMPTQVFARDLVENGGGTIINISSMNALRPLTKIPAYSGAKAAISNFTAWLAVHFAPANIRVNAIAPGFFVTGQNRALLFDSEGLPTARAEKILTHTPMARFGEPYELEGTLLYLADEKSSGFVSGIVLPVDGGFSAYSGV